jgi:choline dehydrogenase-like flavoprotein
VLLCEGGADEFTVRSQSIYQGEVIGDPYVPLDLARLRYFGGSTNHWGGWCRPLDAYDFEAKAAAPVTAWPIGKAALDPFATEAEEILDVAPLPADRPIHGSGLKQVHISITPPARLREKYADDVARTPGLLFCLGANLFGFRVSGERITAAIFRAYDGSERVVPARYFVLATGGIENSRLLLWSNRQAGGGVVPRAEALGRYWMEHPHATLGEALVTAPERLGLDRSDLVFLAPQPATIAELGILNCGLRLHRTDYSGVDRMIADLSCSAPALGRRLARLRGRRLLCGALLRAAWEQEPRRDNRIELDTATDALGMPRTRLYWRKSVLDAHTAKATALALGRYLLDRDIGRVRLDPWLAAEDVQFPGEGEIAGRHHMGGTRMGRSASDAVVDADCRVFGRDNLYLAGSSVFPSVGHANPTLTVVQLSLRLAEHLRARLARSSTPPGFPLSAQ